MGFYIGDKYIETKYFCKHCGSNDMSPNRTEEYVKGWKCNICKRVNYPIKEKYNLEFNDNKE